MVHCHDFGVTLLYNNSSQEILPKESGEVISSLYMQTCLNISRAYIGGPRGLHSNTSLFSV